MSTYSLLVVIRNLAQTHIRSTFPTAKNYLNGCLGRNYSTGCQTICLPRVNIVRRSVYNDQRRSSAYSSDEVQVSDETKPVLPRVQLVDPNSFKKPLEEDDTGAEVDPLELTEQEIWDASPSVTNRPIFTFAALAPESEIVKKFLQLGVSLYKWERKEGIPDLILSLNFDKQVLPIIRLLCDHGFEREDLAHFFTSNPYIFKEADEETLNTRIAYLKSKNFSHDAISAIIVRNPFWLNFSVPDIDRRLGFFQQYFSLTGTEVREVATKGPMLITSKLGRVKDITFTVHERMGFERHEVRTLLLKMPALFTLEPEKVWRRFDYLHNTVQFSHQYLLKFPKALRCSERRLRARIGFLQKIGRDQFDPIQPRYISLDEVIHGSDAHFATEVAESSSIKYNDYLKSL